jgi:hypothetical protein
VTGDRFLRAIPLASAFLWLVVLYAWQSRGHVTPWLFTDELKFTQISRSIAETGHPAQRGHAASFDSLYTYLIAPFWRLGTVATGYAAIKYVGVVVMSSTIFPTYFLARMIVSRGWALFAAVATVAAPALGYATFLLEEPAAYFWSALCLFLIAKALAVRTRWWLIGAGAASAVAGLIRGELAVLLVIYALAAIFLAWTSAPAKEWRRSWGTWDWVGTVVLGIGAVILFSAIVGAHSQSWLIATGYYRHRMIVYGLWAAGALTIGLGVLPVVALAALVRPRGETWTRELKAFTAVTCAALLTFGLYTATKAAFVSTEFSTLVEERNLIYLGPLLFTATALAFERNRLRWWAVAGTAGFCLYVILTTPYNLDLRPYFDALGLSIVQLANRDLAMDDRNVTWLLVVLLIVSVALMLSPKVLRGRRAGIVAAAAAALVIAWNLAGQISASNAINSFSQTLKANYPRPTSWLDRSATGGQAVYLGQRISNTPNGIWLTEFWNRSLQNVWSLDGTAPGPGYFLTPDAGPDGRLTSKAYPEGAPPGVKYVMADTGIDVVGQTVAQPTITHVLTEDQFGFPIHKVVTEKAPWRVVRFSPPLRLAHDVEGIEPDGWSVAPDAGTPAVAVYNQFATAGGKPGFVRVVVSRAGWHGRDRPGSVTIKVGRLTRGPDKQPALGKVDQIRHWVVRAGRQRVFVLPISPPGRVEVSVSPTFSPKNYGRSDPRRLGAQVAFSFSETPPPGR